MRRERKIRDYLFSDLREKEEPEGVFHSEQLAQKFFYDIFTSPTLQTYKLSNLMKVYKLNENFIKYSYNGGIHANETYR